MRKSTLNQDRALLWQGFKFSRRHTLLTNILIADIREYNDHFLTLRQLVSDLHPYVPRQTAPIDAVRVCSTSNLTPTSIAAVLTIVTIHCLSVAFSMCLQNAVPHRIEEHSDIFQLVYTSYRPVEAQEQATANANDRTHGGPLILGEDCMGAPQR